MAVKMIEGKEVSVFPAEDANRPVIYLNSFTQEIDPIRQALKNRKCPDFSLVTITNLEWDHDMAPWDIPPISEGDTPCTGGADDYLRLMEETICPAAEQELPGVPAWRGIAGYSLAGLFAVYALYRTKFFSRAATMSGSLWFPGLLEFTETHSMVRSPECVYFSLGNKEAKTSNPYLRSVQENTEKICTRFKEQGIDATFVLNPGNHYKDPAERTAAGLVWILNHP